MRPPLLALVIAIIWALPGSLVAQAAGQPNIVLIMCDDMGFSDIGCYGGEVRTPNLDRMASQGLRFTQFYNNAKCTTTRASLLTGLYPRKGGKGIQLLDDRMLTLGEALQRAGYQTGMSGKWHLGSKSPHRPIDRGFDEYYGVMDGCCNFFDPTIPDPPYKGNRVRVFGHNDQLVTEFPEDFYTTDAFTDHAIQTIRRFSTGDAPFFVHVTYTAPHYPLHARPEDIARYRGKYKMGWEELRKQRYARQQEIGLIDSTWKLSTGDSRSYDWETADQDFEDLRMSVYAAMIDRMDWNIGRILDTLGELDIDDNTLVLFLSDNGGCAEEPGGRDPAERNPGPKDDYVAVGPAWGWAQNAPFRRYKSWVNEGGISTPLIAHWPGVIKPDTITGEMGHIIDFMPTFLELAGADYPESVDGRELIPLEGLSLLPVLKGGTRAGHPQLCWHWSKNRAIRRGKWKLVWDKLVQEWELYNIAADRTEIENLAAKHPDRVSELSEAWFDWAEMTGVAVK